MRPACCEGGRQPFPSGWHAVHASRCPRYRNGTKIGEETVLDVRPEARAGREHLEVWLRHTIACTCRSCTYVESHLDDDDDDGGKADGDQHDGYDRDTAGRR